MIQYIDRKNNAICTEKVYGERFLKILYGEGVFSKYFLLPLISRRSFASCFYGWLMKRSWSRKKIRPFIEEYGIDEREFETRDFSSFNDFFIRKLRPECRPIGLGDDQLVIPADGRYLVYPKYSSFVVKGREFSLGDFLQDRAYGKRFEEGAIAIARLCPTDYHRFHFSCDGKALKPRLINGFFYSVNPIALKKRLSILAENKRVVTEIETERFGTILYVEVGATSVGSIRQTFVPDQPIVKGMEKGYFEFGGSCIILLFEKDRIEFDSDLIENTARGFETLCQYGTRLGMQKCFS